MTDILIVRVNCASRTEAHAIAAAALEQRLAAAVNIHPPVDSRYRWEGRIERTKEVPLDLKSRPELFEPLADLIARLHSYRTPSILGFPVSHANAAYTAWVDGETAP